MRCLRCKQSFPRRALYCAHCGAARPKRRRLAVAVLASVITLALTVAAFAFFPDILRALSPGGYVGFAAGHTVRELETEATSSRTTWGLPVWETLLQGRSRSSLSVHVSALSDVSVADTPVPFIPENLLENLRFQADIWQDRDLGVLSARHTLGVGDKDFLLDVWLEPNKLTFSAPRVYGHPLTMAPETVARDWNMSFLSALYKLPDGFSIDTAALKAAPEAPADAEAAQNEIEELARKLLRTGTFSRAAEAALDTYDTPVYRISAAMPAQEGGRLLTALLGRAEPAIIGLRRSQTIADTWDELFDGMDTTGFSSCQADFFVDRKSHHLRGVNLSLTLDRAADPCTITVYAAVGGQPKLLDGLALDISRAQGGRTSASLALRAGGLCTPTRDQVMNAALSLTTLNAKEGRRQLDVTAAFDLRQASDNLHISAVLDGARGEASGSYAVDMDGARIALTLSRLRFGDDLTGFAADCDIRYSRWRGGEDWHPPAATGDAQAVSALGRFEQAALLESYYRFFLDTPLYDPRFR